MVFGKPLSEIGFVDIASLRDNQIHESDILDYKGALIDDDLLVKHVSAFANTQGGYIIFGVEETGRGGYPKDLIGIESKDINKERIEQILLSNVAPRLHVRIREIPHTTTGRSFLVLQIPDSSFEPHMNRRLGKYFKRYQFESTEMTEAEISDAYRRRYSGYQAVEDYLRTVIARSDPRCRSMGQIVALPTVLDRRLIETSDPKDFQWLDPNKIDFQPSGFAWAATNGFLPTTARPSPNGVIFGGEHTNTFHRYLELHRNGCLEFGRDVAGFELDQSKGLFYFILNQFTTHLLQVLQFFALIYSKYNYVGDVRLVVSIRPSNPLVLPRSSFSDQDVRCLTSIIYTEREIPAPLLETNFSQISADLMNDIFHDFGRWRCHLFDEKGNYIINRLSGG